MRLQHLRLQAKFKSLLSFAISCGAICVILTFLKINPG